MLKTIPVAVLKLGITSPVPPAPDWQDEQRGSKSVSVKRESEPFQPTLPEYLGKHRFSSDYLKTYNFIEQAAA